MNNFNPLRGDGRDIPTDFDSRDPLVNDTFGNAYHVVRGVYQQMGLLDSLYEFLMQYGLTTNVAVKSPVEAVVTEPNNLEGNQIISWDAHSGSYQVLGTTGMRVLVINQTDPKNNGIYNVNPRKWTRAVDFIGPMAAVDGTLVFSRQGDCWQVHSPTFKVEVGVTPIIFRDIDVFAFEAVETATQKAKEAAESAASALASKEAAALSETNAKASEESALDSKNSASADASRAAGSADAAKNSEDAAKTYATLAQSNVHIYPTAADAQAAITNGTETKQFFYVRSTNPLMLAEEYENVAGVATPLGRGIVSSDVIKALQALISTVNEHPEVLWNFTDVDGMSVWRIMQDGSFGTKLTMVSPNGLDTTKVGVRYDPNTEGLVFTDADGLGVRVVSPEGVVAPNAVQQLPNNKLIATDENWLELDTGEFRKVIIDGFGELVLPQWVLDLKGGNNGGGSDALAKRNAANLAYSATIKGTFDTKVKRLTKMINHVIWYGQSLSSNQEGWPALSRTPYANLDAYMIGDSSRGNSRTAPNFVPIGGNVLKPLKAVVQTPGGEAVLTQAQEAALSPGAPNEGEGGVAAVNMFKQLFLKHRQEDRDEDRKIILSNTGVNGRSIEQLSKGFSPELYNRPRQAVQIAKQIAADMNLPYGVLAIAWLQGEWNSWGNNGSEDYQTYLDNMKILFDNMRKDFAYNNGQVDVPAVFMYQTGAQYTRDNNQLSIGRAQTEFCRMANGNHAYLATPSYPFPDKGGHLTSNGYRWMDMQFAKVMFKVLVLGEGWEPLRPIGYQVDGTKLTIDYHVPSPPLQFRDCYYGLNVYNTPNKGFRLVDANGPIALSSVKIVADTVIEVTASRPIVYPLEIFYAGQAGDVGNGNVYDSDATIATENYVYTAGSGQYPGENIAALVDKPYPLNNASVAWYHKIES